MESSVGAAGAQAGGSLLEKLLQMEQDRKNALLQAQKESIAMQSAAQQGMARGEQDALARLMEQYKYITSV